jgi:hypothetical protein
MSQTKAQLLDGKASSIQFSAGSASSPTISFTGDTNTGIYSPGADQVAISTAGTGRLFVDASGVVRQGSPTDIGGGTVSLGYLAATNTTSGSSFTAIKAADAINATSIIFRKARGSLSSLSAVQTGDNIGYIPFQAYGGTAFEPGAELTASVTQYTSPTNWSSHFFINTRDGSAAFERLRITSTGNVGIGTTAPQAVLHVEKNQAAESGVFLNNSDAGGYVALRLGNSDRGTNGDHLVYGGTVLGLRSKTGTAITFEPAGSEKARLDSSGRLLVGTSSARANFNVGARTAVFQIEGTSADTSFLSITRNSNNTAPCGIVISKSRGTAVGSNTIVADGDDFGEINFEGADGTNMVRGAQIRAVVDGTPSANDMPGRLVFLTTADGTSSPTERMRLTAAGRMQLTGAYDNNIVAVAALDIDCSAGNYFTKTINGNSTFTVSNVPSSRAFAFTLELTHTSGTITWFSGVEWPGGVAPTLTTGKTHLFMFVTDDGGTRWRASSLINYTN